MTVRVYYHNNTNINGDEILPGFRVSTTGQLLQSQEQQRIFSNYTGYHFLTCFLCLLNRHHFHSFVRLFEARFDPSIKDRDALVSAIKKSLEELFVQVTDVVHDYILKSIYNLIMAILRTNYYQGDKPYLSLKFDSEAVPDIPLPKPFRGNDMLYLYVPKLYALIQK